MMDEAELVARGYNLDQVEWEIYEEERIRQAMEFHGPNFVNYVYIGGRRKLHSCATSAYLIRLLLSYGANINQQTNTGCTPLMYSIHTRHCNIQAVECLLDSGADPDITNKDGDTAFDYALLGSDDIILLFLRRGIASVFRKELPYWMWKHVYVFIFCVPLCLPRFHKSCWLPLDCIRLLSTYL
jgi:hypothetical protein